MEEPTTPATSLKLFGSWASSFTHRVQLALKLKGLVFDYVEEDLSNKSPSLLLLNPIYKKVPVLLHGSRPVAESVVILQYLDETFKENPIMSDDPYERAVARFWCHFVDDKLGPAVGTVFGSSGEVQRAAVGQVHDNLRILEEEMRDGIFKGRRFFGGEKIGLFDVVLGCGSYWLSVFEEVAEVKLIDEEAFPLFDSWLRKFEGQPEVKEIIPATDKLLEFARGVRAMLLNLANATATADGVDADEASNAAVAAAAAENLITVASDD